MCVCSITGCWNLYLLGHAWIGLPWLVLRSLCHVSVADVAFQDTVGSYSSSYSTDHSRSMCQLLVLQLIYLLSDCLLSLA
jgi:hypothetical protein